MQLTCYWDSADDPRATCEPPCELLCGFLESDLQGSTELCREVLQSIDRVISGQQPSWQETGNAYTLLLSGQEACIEAEFDDQAEPCRLPLAELRDAVAQWLAFLEGE